MTAVRNIFLYMCMKLGMDHFIIFFFFGGGGVGGGVGHFF